MVLAFNAALVILGALWVCRGDDSDEASVPPDMDKLVEKASGYPQRAVAALLNLDSGNKMVDRCRYYLEHFNNALNPVGESTRFIPLRFLRTFSSMRKRIITVTCLQMSTACLSRTIPPFLQTRLRGLDQVKVKVLQAPR